MKRTFWYLQLTFSVSILIWATYLAIHTWQYSGDIHPFTRYGWNSEQYGIAIILAFLGGLLLTFTLRQASSAAVVFLLAAISICFDVIFLRYFWISIAIGSELAILLSIFTLVRQDTEQRIGLYLGVTGLVALSLASACFFSISILSRGA